MTLIEPHILRGHVPMNKAPLMEMSQTAAELTPESENFIERPLPSFPQVLGERSAAKVFKHHVLDGAVHVYFVVVKRYDVVMAADTAENLGLPLGALRIFENRLRPDK